MTRPASDGSDGRSDAELIAEVAAYIDSLHTAHRHLDWRIELSERELAAWVARLLGDFELWQTIPACWNQHPAMINELRVCLLLERFIDHEDPDDPMTLMPRRAEWHDYLARVIERLSQSPGAECARRGEHRPARGWDRHAAALARQAARQANTTPDAER
jgi:hypothetical protein